MYVRHTGNQVKVLSVLLCRDKLKAELEELRASITNGLALSGGQTTKHSSDVSFISQGHILCSNFIMTCMPVCVYR